jgi:hypothetical protein
MIALAALPAHAAPKVTTVFTDPAGDAALNPRANNKALPTQAQAGLDIVKGTIARSKNDLQFTVSLSQSLSTYGEVPEAVRLVWQFTVNKKTEYRFTVKSFDVGKPDAVQEDGTDRVGHVSDKGLFRLEKCGEPFYPGDNGSLSFSKCTEIGTLVGKIDAGGKKLSWTLPMAKVGAKTGSLIANGAGGLNGTGCYICIIAHYAERSLSPDTVIDDAETVNPKYVIPKA